MKNKTIFFRKWLSTRCLDTHLAESLSTEWSITMETSETKVSSLTTCFDLLTFVTRILHYMIKNGLKIMNSEAENKDNQNKYKLCHHYYYNLQLVGFVEHTIQAIL